MGGLSPTTTPACGSLLRHPAWVILWLVVSLAAGQKVSLQTAYKGFDPQSYPYPVSLLSKPRQKTLNPWNPD